MHDRIHLVEGACNCDCPECIDFDECICAMCNGRCSDPHSERVW